MSNEYKDWCNDLNDKQRKNYELCMKYPILIPRNRWTGEVPSDYDYSYTELDAMPPGWEKAFGEQWAKEIQEAINLASRDIRIMDIKEKWGFLHTYFSGYTDELQEVINKYEDLSWRTCIECGEPATRKSMGWISPYCDECSQGLRTIDIDEEYPRWN